MAFLSLSSAGKTGHCQAVRRCCIIIYHSPELVMTFYDSCVCEHFSLQIQSVCWKPSRVVAGVNFYAGFVIQRKLEQKPQQSAVSNTNTARPHGSSIILMVNRTPAPHIIVSKLRYQHTRSRPKTLKTSNGTGSSHLSGRGVG